VRELPLGRNICGTAIAEESQICSPNSGDKDFAIGLNLPVSNQASKFWVAISSEKLDAVGSHGGEERDRSCTGAF
jgi:hypothetical protein